MTTVRPREEGENALLDGTQPRPDHVTTVRRFIDSMRQLKAWSGLSYRQIEVRARANGDTLPYSTVATMLRSDSLPRVELVATFTRACGCDAGQVDEWIRTRRRLAIELSREAADDPPTSPRELDPQVQPRSSPVPPPVVPRQLPSVTRHFVGRARLLKQLDALLDDPADKPTTATAPAIAMITGAAGIGKPKSRM